MQNIKNAHPFLFAIIAFVTFSSIILFPIDSMLIKMSFSDFQSEYIGLTIKMTLIFILSYRIIKKMKLESIAGFSANYNWESKYLNSIPIYLIVLGVLSIWSRDLSQIHIGNIFLLLLACLTVGFAEEFLFRGLLQSVFLKKYHASKNGILISLLFSAFIFGLFHLINLTKNDNVPAVFIQAVYATFIGFFFGILVLRTNKIIPVAITHGLINFFFSIAFLPGIKVMEETELSIAPILLTSPLFIAGLFFVKTIKKDVVVNKLNESFNEP